MADLGPFTDPQAAKVEAGRVEEVERQIKELFLG